MPDNGRRDGVYYAQADYAGIGRRLAILAVDGTMLLAMLLATIASYTLLTPDSLTGFHVHAAILIVAWFLYLAVLARTTRGTLGYSVTGVRPVNLHGETPSLGAMSYRSLFVALGPLNGAIDLLWVAGDRDRQALRDKLAGTYMVRRTAQPAGRGPIRHATMTALGYTFMVQEVGRVQGVAREPGP